MLPIALRLNEEAIRQRTQRFFHRSAPTKNEVAAAGEREGLLREIRNGNVGRETELAFVTFETNVVRAVDARRDTLGPAEAGSTNDADARRALNGLDDAKELRRAEGAVVLREARGEIQNSKGTGGRVEARFQNVGVLEIGLLAVFAVRRAHEEFAAVFFIEQRGKNRLGIETRQTTPHNFTRAIDERG